jgi:hypothetical protein
MEELVKATVVAEAENMEAEEDKIDSIGEEIQHTETSNTDPSEEQAAE